MFFFGRGQRGFLCRRPFLASVLCLCVNLIPGSDIVWAQDSAQSDELDFLLEERASAPSATAKPLPATDQATQQPDEPPPLASTPEPETLPAEQVKPSKSRAVEEIVVTAQKREQAIEDVPISMSVISQEFIAEQGITDVREAMLFVPNVKVEEAGFFASPRVRGFSFNNNNKAFEPPAGLAIDGIPYTRVEYFNAALFDVNRLEVLRGPQGTTFGKNTTAGLIHIITQNPSETFNGFADVQSGDLDRQRLEFGVGGPLVDGLVNFRIAGLTDERDGFVENTTAEISGADPLLRGQSRKGLRGKLEFPDVWDSNLRLSFESVELSSIGAGVELFNVSPAMAATLRRYDPNVDIEKGNQVASIDAPDDGRTVEIETFVGELNRKIGDWDMVVLGGHSVLKNNLSVDTDFTPAPAIFGTDTDRSPSSTLELRALSPQLDGLLGLNNVFGLSLGHSNFLGGVYYQKRKIEGDGFKFRFETVPFLDLTIASAPDSPDSDPLEPLFDVLPPQLLPLLLGVLPADLPLTETLFEETQQGFEQEATSVALFSQLDWNFLERWALQLGMRFGKEEKNARWQQQFTTSGLPPIILPLAGMEEFTAERSQSEEQFQPKVALNFQPNDDISLFLHWARAFKGGGFNAFAFRPVDEELVYGPEEAEEWGFDSKMTLFDGAARLNFSLYRLDINDFQVLTRVPENLTLGLGVTKVENAAQARAQGMEADFTWLATDWLSLITTLGYNDTEYLDFKINDCPADREDTDGDGDLRCDATGKPFAFAPKYGLTFTPQLTFPVFGGDILFTAGTTVEYQSEQFLDIDLDERKTQEAFFRYRANVGIANPGKGWSFRIIGENLTNESTSIRQGDVVPGLFVNIQEPPRQIFGKFRYSF